MASLLNSSPVNGIIIENVTFQSQPLPKPFPRLYTFNRNRFPSTPFSPTHTKIDRENIKSFYVAEIKISKWSRK